MKSSKNIFKLIAAFVSLAAVITTIIIFRKQICEVCSKLKSFIQQKVKKFNRPEEYDDFADV